MYSDGMRRMQDKKDARRIADALEAHTVRAALTDDDRAFIARAPFFFLATAGKDGTPDCSYKGGAPGFVSVDATSLSWLDLDGNGQFRSLGNVLENPRVSLLFIDFATPRRLRVHGTATLVDEDDSVRVIVAVERAFPNCPRYIHKMKLEELSPYVQDDPPVPSWKKDPRFCDALPRPRPPR